MIAGTECPNPRHPFLKLQSTISPIEEHSNEYTYSQHQSAGHSSYPTPCCRAWNKVECKRTCQWKKNQRGKHAISPPLVYKCSQYGESNHTQPPYNDHQQVVFNAPGLHHPHSLT